METKCAGAGHITLSLLGYFASCNLTLERQVYAKALGSFPDRIKNLYFSYLFLLRAVNKVLLHDHLHSLFF